jgi:hypothetical protein
MASSRISVFSCAPMVSSPKYVSAPIRLEPVGVVRPFVRSRNSINRSRMLTGIGQPNTRKHPSSALALRNEQNIGADRERRRRSKLILPQSDGVPRMKFAGDHAYRRWALARRGGELEVHRPHLRVLIQPH